MLLAHQTSAAMIKRRRSCLEWRHIAVSRRYLLRAVAEYASEIGAAARLAMSKAERGGNQLRPDHESFAARPVDDTDDAIMEKASKVAVAPVDMGWSDVGNWDALY